MNRNQYEQDERMHRGIGRERELERQRNQQFQGQYSRESGYTGSGAYAQMDDDFYEREANRMQSGRYPSGSGGYGGMERQWQTPSSELHGGNFGQSNFGSQYGQPYAQQYGQLPYGQSSYGQSPYGQSPYGQSQFGQSQFGQERWQPSQLQGGYGPSIHPGQQAQYGQPYGQQGLYGQQGSFGNPGLYESSGLSSQGLRGQSGQENFRGRGPKGYTRSDERIKEEVCELLTRHPEIDASDIEIEARQGVITLTGSVDQRHLKHQIENLVENVSGVKDVENRLTVKTQSSSSQSGRGGQTVGVTTGSLGGSSESKPRH